MENPGKDNFFKTRSNEELEEMLKILMLGDNNGGLLANDIIEELTKRYAKLGL
jgi:hypothetical protein